MAVITLGLVTVWWYLDYPSWLGYLLAICALLTVYTTSMIYAQMRSVQTWNTHLTPAVFTFMALAGGGLMCALGASFAGGVNDIITIAVMLIAAWAFKAKWWRRADSDIELSDAASATGLGGSGPVTLFESPHSGTNYLLNEMGFRVGRKHARKLRRIALVAGGAVPLVALAMVLKFDDAATALISISVLTHLIGVLAERWLFFAEARHAVMSFYD